jgi:hypothetical protein
MARCSDCGFPVKYVTTAEGGDKFPIDERADQITGNHRYYFPDPQNEPEVVALMGAGHIGYGHGDHRETCPENRRKQRL